LLLQKEQGKGVRGRKKEKGKEREAKEERESELPPYAGLAALRRLLNAPSGVLGEYALPLETLRVVLHGSAEVGEVGHRSMLQWGTGGQQQQQQLLLLGSRLGSGGNSDVYECQSPPNDSRVAAVAVAGALAAVKVARRGTEDVLRGFEAERRSLAALALGGAPNEGLVPHCLGFGARVRTGKSPLVTARSMVGREYSWPVLLLHPVGTPLEHWVKGCEEESMELAESKKEKEDGGESAGAMGTAAAKATAAAAAAARVACADKVLPRVLRALSAAHSAGWVHSDVRPSNIIVTEQRGAMLVDWGAAACTTEQEKVWCCVPAFSAKVMLSEKQPRAQPALDGVGALYTWLAIAHGYACTPPWAYATHFASNYDMANARSEWLRLKALTDPRVESVLGALDVLEGALAVKGKPLYSKDVLDIAGKALGFGAGGPG